MAIPDFQTIMLPFLKKLKDGQPHHIREIANQIADEYRLTDEERNLRSANSTNNVFRNKVGWTKTHLLRANLIENPSRGIVKISSRGIQILNSNPDRIDMRFLGQYPEYAEFRRTSSVTPTQDREQIDQHLTPIELLEQGYKDQRSALEEELLNEIKGSSPAFLENLVLDLLLAMGYGGSKAEAASAIGRSHDGGVDGVIKEDKLGLDLFYVQAKRWDRNVGRPEIQAFVGSLEGMRAKKGIFITTSEFTNDARNYVNSIEKKIILMDGTQLAKLMFEYNIGVSIVATYPIKKLDNDYFSEESAV